MTQAQEFFIQLISDHLNGRSTDVPEGLDWSSVAELAKAHDLAGIVFYQCQDTISADALPYFSREYAAEVFLYANRRVALDTISARFRDAKIAFHTIKGFAVSKYYPLPALRTMGDCDIIVETEHIPAASEIMKGLGYELTSNFRNEYIFHKGLIIIEIHDVLVKDRDRNDDTEMATPAQSVFFNNYRLYADGEVFDASFHFLYLLMHLRKHIMNSGAGIRQFADLAVTVSKCPDLRWDWISEKLPALELDSFADSCFCLIREWFGISVPIGSKQFSSEQLAFVTSKILFNGLFGFEDPENSDNYFKNQIIKNKGARWIVRLKLLLQTLFPDYAWMCRYRGCEYLSGKPYLLPVAWFHRVLIIIRERRTKGALNRAGLSMISDKHLDSRETYLDIMGL